MGNAFAYLVLALWPLIAIYLYGTKSIQVASVWTILGGFMFLPVNTVVDLPMIPPLGKHTVPVVSALIGCWFVKNKRILYFNGIGKIKYLVILLILSPFITAALNSDSLLFGQRFIKGLTYYDGLSEAINQFFLITPFFIGRQFFKTYDDQLVMFKLLVIAGLFYSLPILFEIRMSPQLHAWIYGYFPGSFGQQMRQGGFRAVVFMGHGLSVAFFTCIVLISSLVLWDKRIKILQFSPLFVSCYFLGLLILCKSIAALLFGGFAWVAIKKIKTKNQHQMAILLVIVTMLYPSMSMMKVFPHETLVGFAASVSAERAQSIKFRFDNEHALLERAEKRFYFGWGGWGRSRVYNEESGKDESVTDGRWIITIGKSGILGFIAEFGLLAFTVFKAYSASKVLNAKDDKVLLAAHALIVGIIMMNLIPNSSLSPWHWLLVGILFGRSGEIITQHKLESKKARAPYYVG